MARIYGTPGASLAKATTMAHDAVQAGLQGERTTATILNAIDADVHVFHSLRVPGFASGDVDHAVVTGNKLVLIDSKQWKAGFYWSLGGRVFRGRHRYKPAEKRTFAAASKAFGAKFKVSKALVVVHTRGPVSLRFLRAPGVEFVTPGQLVRKLGKLRSADLAVSSALGSWLAGQRRAA